MATLLERMSEALKGGYQGQILPDLSWRDVDEYVSGTGRYDFLRGQGGAPGQDDIDALIAAALGGGAGGFGGGGGGFGGGGAAGGIDQSAVLRLQAELDALESAKQRAYDSGQTGLAQQFQAQQDALMREFQTGERIGGQEFQTGERLGGQEFQAAESERQREFLRQQALEELKAERQRIFNEMMGKDPIRAALFAMGIGGELVPGGERFADLPPLAGAETYAKRGASALSALTGSQVGVGRQGVTGLPNVVKAAGAYSAGQRPAGAGPVGDLDTARKVLLSGYGVGALPGAGRPGVGPEEAVRKIKSVTPTGAAFLPRR